MPLLCEHGVCFRVLRQKLFLVKYYSLRVLLRRWDYDLANLLFGRLLVVLNRDGIGCVLDNLIDVVRNDAVRTQILEDRFVQARIIF